MSGNTEKNPAASPEVLQMLAGELKELSRVGLKLQDLIGAEVRSGKLGTAAMVDAQAADLLSQYLHEIAKFLEAYSVAIQREESDPLGSAASTLLLGDLARRLSQHGNVSETTRTARGDLEMF